MYVFPAVSRVVCDLQQLMNDQKFQDMIQSAYRLCTQNASQIQERVQLKLLKDTIDVHLVYTIHIMRITKAIAERRAGGATEV